MLSRGICFYVRLVSNSVVELGLRLLLVRRNLIVSVLTTSPISPTVNVHCRSGGFMNPSAQTAPLLVALAHPVPAIITSGEALSKA